MVSGRQSPSEQSSFANHLWRRILLLLIFVLVAAMAGYAAGLAEHNRRFTMVEATNKALLEEVTGLRERQHQARLKLASLKSDRAVDVQAMREARATIVALETRIAKLESDLGFYRNIMSPSENERGFQLDHFVVKPTEQHRAFDFALVVIQVGNNERFMSGRLAITVKGVQDGNPKEIGLHELLSEIVADEEIKYRFRYFQDIEGRLVLPEGFQPEEVRVVARARNRSEPVLEGTWGWSDLLVRETPNS